MGLGLGLGSGSGLGLGLGVGLQLGGERRLCSSSITSGWSNPATHLRRLSRQPGMRLALLLASTWLGLGLGLGLGLV